MSCKLRALSIALCLIAAPAALGQGGERILEYVIDVDVSAGGALDVVEQVTVRAEAPKFAAASIATFRRAIVTATATTSSLVSRC